ncbi:hypothetical protein NSE_0159 [Neorickettsia sennetsu str. Miyayama]|uniref:Uncharacterized protein n=1 Tax=Ehrlichia sennetsu (strain ATCC VR-367 / Miyayama) TaxID=222891 RepID=Q2GEN9_EHRS3|nr:hypothetical protein NSE_0159 [Neorickettsia sennetsu str. Miyayama]
MFNEYYHLPLRNRNFSIAISIPKSQKNYHELSSTDERHNERNLAQKRGANREYSQLKQLH